jgi:hypothetical protein
MAGEAQAAGNTAPMRRVRADCLAAPPIPSHRTSCLREGRGQSAAKPATLNPGTAADAHPAPAPKTACSGSAGQRGAEARAAARHGGVQEGRVLGPDRALPRQRRLGADNHRAPRPGRLAAQRPQALDRQWWVVRRLLVRQLPGHACTGEGVWSISVGGPEAIGSRASESSCLCGAQHLIAVAASIRAPLPATPRLPALACIHTSNPPYLNALANPLPPFLLCRAATWADVIVMWARNTENNAVNCFIIRKVGTP